MVRGPQDFEENLYDGPFYDDEQNDVASYLEKNNQLITNDSRVENNYSQQYSPQEAISI